MDGVLRVRMVARNGGSCVAESYAHAPYHYLPPVDRAGEPPLLTVVNSSGGILGGDVLDLHLDLGAGAAVSVRQQSATRVYQTTREPSRSHNRFTLGRDAFVDYFPDEIIPYAGSAFEQTTEIELAEGAVMLFGEIVTAGRLARDECFAFARLTIDLQCRSGGQVVLRERADLDPRQQPLAGRAILGDALLWGGFYLLTSAPADPTLTDELDAILCDITDARGGATAAPAGIVGRVVGRSLESARNGLQAARAAALRQLGRGGHG